MNISFIVKIILVSHLLTAQVPTVQEPIENTTQIETETTINVQAENEAPILTEETTQIQEESNIEIVVLDSIESVQDATESDTTQENTFVMPHIEKVELEMYTTTSLNVRMYPDKTSEKIGSIPSGTKVRATGICDNNWYEIEFNDGIGFINGKYLTKAPVYTGIIKTNGEIDYSLIKTADDYYHLIPEHIRNHFSQNEWQIIITTEDLGTRFFDGDPYVLAVTSSNDKSIFLDDRTAGVESIIHEFGHYIDFKSGFVSYTKEFADIFNQEVVAFRSVHKTHSANTQNPMEYFAEFYQEYILHPEKIKDICPQTYNFVELYSNNLQ